MYICIYIYMCVCIYIYARGEHSGYPKCARQVQVSSILWCLRCRIFKAQTLRTLHTESPLPCENGNISTRQREAYDSLSLTNEIENILILVRGVAVTLDKADSILGDYSGVTM
jgi:hypothetical protein